MRVECFLDTNVVVYAAAADSDTNKRERALDLLERAAFGTSAQVLQEVYVAVVRKLAVPLEPETALEWIEQLAVFPCVAVDSAIVRIAIEKSERYRISFWDAAILAAAEALDAKVLYTEDLNDGQLYGSVRAVNPFRVASY